MSNSDSNPVCIILANSAVASFFEDHQLSLHHPPTDTKHFMLSRGWCMDKSWPVVKLGTIVGEQNANKDYIIFEMVLA